jgi:hypothetical protein
MSTDFRALCAELLATLELTWEIKPRVIQDLLNRARAALAAEPVGEGPSDEELDELAKDFMCITEDGTGFVDDHEEFARAVLARWGTPATPPAPEPGEVGE